MGNFSNDLPKGDAGRSRLAVAEAASIQQTGVWGSGDADETVASARAAEVLLDAVTASSAGSLNVRRTAIKILTVVRPELADWSMILLPDLKPGAWLLVGGDDVGFYDVISPGAVDNSLLGRVLRTGLTERVQVAAGVGLEASLAEVIPHPRLVAEATTLPPADVLSIALRARGLVIGVLVLVRGLERRFTQADVELGERVCRRAAAGLDGALHHEQRAHMAAVMQRSLRPPVLPDIDAFAVAARYRSAEENLDIGGDFYDINVGADDWLIGIGDVCGKGIEAAVVTGRARQSLRTAAYFERRPEMLLSAINAVHHSTQTGGFDPFVTMACVRVRRRDPAGLHVDVAVAGHPAPLVVRADGTVEQPPSRGLALGLRPAASYSSDTLILHPGDGMLLFTDGIDEAPGHDGPYGMARVHAVLSRHAGMSAEVLCEAVEHDVMEYLESRTHDDMALLALTCPQ